MNQDPLYFKLHKQEYTLELDRLDARIRERILDNPECHEAQMLAQRVNTKVLSLMGVSFPIADAFKS